MRPWRRVLTDDAGRASPVARANSFLGLNGETSPIRHGPKEERACELSAIIFSMLLLRTYIAPGILPGITARTTPSDEFIRPRSSRRCLKALHYAPREAEKEVDREDRSAKPPSRDDRRRSLMRMPKRFQIRRAE